MTKHYLKLRKALTPLLIVQKAEGEFRGGDPEEMRIKREEKLIEQQAEGIMEEDLGGEAEEVDPMEEQERKEKLEEKQAEKESVAPEKISTEGKTPPDKKEEKKEIDENKEVLEKVRKEMEEE